MMQAQRLLRVELTVADLGRAEAFYEAALGFVAISRGEADPALARLLGAERITQAGLHRGGQTLLLQCFEPPGEPYPTGSRSCDQVFQHIAVPVADMAAAYARLQPFAPPPLSRRGSHIKHLASHAGSEIEHRPQCGWELKQGKLNPPAVPPGPGDRPAGGPHV